MFCILLFLCQAAEEAISECVDMLEGIGCVNAYIGDFKDFVYNDVILCFLDAQHTLVGDSKVG